MGIKIDTRSDDSTGRWHGLRRVSPDPARILRGFTLGVNDD